MKISVLASGSKGNVTYLEIEGKIILIDCGLSLSQTKSRLKENKLSLNHIDYIFITHEHSDHISALGTFIKAYDPVIYLSLGTYHALNDNLLKVINFEKCRFLKADTLVNIDQFAVLPFLVNHDSVEPLGFRFFHHDKSLVFLTDCGYYPRAAYDKITNANIYVIESNHEPSLLLESDRPWLIKKRTLDDNGHLSNQDSAYLLTKVIGPKTRVIILAHMSEECNLDEIAYNIHKEVFALANLDIKDFQFYLSKQDKALPLIEI